MTVSKINNMEDKYRVIRGKYQRSVDEAKRVYMLSGSSRDKERLDYLEVRMGRYTHKGK